MVAQAIVTSLAACGIALLVWRPARSSAACGAALLAYAAAYGVHATGWIVTVAIWLCAVMCMGALAVIAARTRVARSPRFVTSIGVGLAGLSLII